MDAVVEEVEAEEVEMETDMVEVAAHQVGESFRTETLRDRRARRCQCR